MVRETHPTMNRLTKAAIVSLDPPNPVPKVIVFQYNPATLSRSLKAQQSEASNDRSEAIRLKGAPMETLSLELELDASDQLEQSDSNAMAMGLHPQLATLEMLLYPASATVTGNLVKLALGLIEIVPPLAPLTVFIFGARRILPIQLTDFSVEETLHDPQLNPLQAKVSLSMRVLSYNDLSPQNPGHALFLAHQVSKEVLAAMGTTSSLGAVVKGDVRLI